MANRGNVVYTDVTPAAAGTSAIAQPTIGNMCDIITINLKESTGFEAVKNNPNVYPNKTTRLLDSGSESTLASLKSSIVVGTSMTAAQINSMINLENNLLARTIGGSVATVASGSPENVSTLTAACDNLKTVSTYFDNVNGWWDSNNYCKIGCQIACQDACQLACQSCQYNTCHDQNCGGWS